MAVRHTRCLVAGLMTLALVGAAATTASADGQGREPQPTPGQFSTKGWDFSGSKMTPKELAAFRKAQGYKGDGTDNGRKDEAWLKSLRKKMGTGEFAAAKGSATTVAGGPDMSPVDPDPYALTTGSGYAYIGWMAQRQQVTNSACGKATVQEMSITVPGASSASLTQAQVASYLGETTSSATNATEELNALGHFVGQPNFGRSFYESSWLSDPPTSTEKATFWSRLKTDMSSYKTPVVTGVIEVKDGPRLVGHPNLTRIEHWVIAGGWNDNNSTVHYADSWTGYGYPIPTKSWISKTTFLYAAGGWVYQW